MILEHMLRKTAAIAVLILVISSCALGSTGRVQTVAGTGSDEVGGLSKGTYLADLSFLADHKLKADGTASQGYAQKTPRPEGTFTFVKGAVGTAGVVFGTTAADIDGEGPVQMMTYGIGGTPAQFVNGGTDESPDPVLTPVISVGNLEQTPEVTVSTIIFYMDTLRMEMPAMPFYTLAAHGNYVPVGAIFRSPGHSPAMEDDLILNMKAAMLFPGMDPQLFDFQWKNDRKSLSMENGSLVRFSGYATLHERNGSLETSGQPIAGYGPATGVIEINSDMMVDLANLSARTTAAQADDTYDNRIAAGETKWHSIDVGDAVKSLNVDIKWSDPDSKLRLVVYTPDGKVLGPYYDDSDGKADGRINLNIANPSGVASGEWHLKVTDLEKLGSDDYYVRTY